MTMVRSIVALLLVHHGILRAAARSLWSAAPATYGSSSDDDYILKTGYLLGSGKLGAIPFGPPGGETLVLNLDSLWSGGPFASTNYTGGNPVEPVYQYLPGIREWIFQNGTGNVSELLNEIVDYGTYQTLGNLSVAFDASSEYTDYTRVLNLTTGVHQSSWTSNGSLIQSTVFCSFPAQSCVYSLSSNTTLPSVTIALANNLMDSSLVNTTCGSGYTRLDGITQQDIGLRFTSIAQLLGNVSATCSSTDHSLTVSSLPNQNSITVVFSAESDYNQTNGDAVHDYSFRGAAPGPVVEQRTNAAAAQSYNTLLEAHVDDYSSLMGRFTLSLPDTANSSTVETANLVARYGATNATTTDPYLEALLFDYARHLLVSSSREGTLPANLQGHWTESLYPAWSGDYHANINLQMNYWPAEQTGLGELAKPLFAYLENTWVPRGSETAKLLYNASEGWVAHDEVNIFGYTGMKNAAQWANYPASAAWLMQHVFDHFDYHSTSNATSGWLSDHGYPLLKGIAAFWLSQLQEDLFFDDGTLVVNPCNSPEQGPTTFGCTHYQQLITQVFSNVLSAASGAGAAETDADFLSSVTAALGQLDRGIHVAANTTDDGDGSTGDDTNGVLKEWKVPSTYLYDTYPQHRHLSHLVGWFPGYSVSSFAGGYATNATIQAAVRASLVQRGDGTSTDGDGGNYGWPKVWRAACWARLNESEQAYGELQLAVKENVAGNLLSMYGGGGKTPPFQIDMNFGWAGAMLSMLVVDLPLEEALGAELAVRTVVLGPAIPPAWGGGSVAGLRIRGGVEVDFAWDENGVVTEMTLVSGSVDSVRFVNVRGEEL
ncbi:Six-hairpin glycosidase-like protein [Coniella lustricola]|uniref:Six-hairpin glycosidase-like protein n=1 Tax=Coniella lustricola TaxID=2025994 RepID=A0A2T3AHL1_9PEZI|nr:Six-hairpin glycosidase-like protein [Coniella lustricola]